MTDFPFTLTLRRWVRISTLRSCKTLNTRICEVSKYRCKIKRALAQLNFGIRDILWPQIIKKIGCNFFLLFYAIQIGCQMYC